MTSLSWSADLLLLCGCALREPYHIDGDKQQREEKRASNKKHHDSSKQPFIHAWLFFGISFSDFMTFVFVRAKPLAGRSRARRRCGASPGRRSRPRCYDGVTVGVALGVGLAVGVGVGVGPGPPPFAVHRIVPLSPTAIPRNASLAKETSLRLAEVPLVWSVQAIPTFVVCKIRPPAAHRKPTCCICYWKINALYRLIEE